MLRTMKRLSYLNRTTIAVAIAYFAIRLTSSARTGAGLYDFPNAKELLDPFLLLNQEGPLLLVSVAVHVLLAMALATFSVSRAADAGWNRWTGLLIILPVIRLFVFVALAIAPSTLPAGRELLHHRWLDRVIPTSRIGSAVAGVFVAVSIVLPLGLLDVRIIERYGTALFIGLPFILGSVSAVVDGYHTQRSVQRAIGVACVSVTVTMALIFLFAAEGIICLVMSAPLVYPIAIVGGLIGHSLTQSTLGRMPTSAGLVAIVPAMMAFESIEQPEPPLFSVATSIEVNATPQETWAQLVTFSRMEEPEELLFRAGIAYPIEATINGRGIGACRVCRFNTGPFIEPITTWDEPRVLAFSVEAFPPPMTELSIYEHVNAPHIDGFFQSRRGQFKLTALPGGRTRLEGTTWYTHDIWPVWFWRLWSDRILHAIHARVLKHIKLQAEGSTPLLPLP